MITIHAVLNFIRFSIPEKIAFARKVISGLGGNPIFSNPDFPLKDLEELTDDLENQFINSRKGRREDIALMHQTEAIWNDKMRKMAKYVDRIAEENAVIILSAGFSIPKIPAPKQRPDFSVELGEKSGTVLLRRQRVKGAKAYIWQYYIGTMPGNESEWKIIEVTAKASVELTGLIALNKYWFRVAAVLSDGTTAYTAPIMQTVI